jgi:tetratricopeptide (TPR) repeat protein
MLLSLSIASPLVVIKRSQKVPFIYDQINVAPVEVTSAMTPNEALEVADEVLFAHTGKHLTDLQRMILQESWADKSYMDMLDQGWALPTIRKAGNELWNLLSGALGEKVGKTSFRGALEKRLRAGDIVPKPPMQSSYNEQTWVGREALITDLLSKLQGQTRLLWITGISGIGKTTLGECLASQAWESDPAFHWIYLEILEGQSPDFPSVAANLLGRIGDRDLDPQERNNSEQVARRLLQRLQSHRYWIQIDALERLFKVEHPTEFVDAYWVTFLQRCLTNSAFASRLVLTSQAFPNALVEFNDRYPNGWTEIRLDGLLQVEQQLEFFAKRGIAVDSSNQDILTQIAKIYEGHPLVLKVIAEDILKNFAGDVAHYWQIYQREFEQVARELQAARLDETEYNEALDRKVRERIKRSLEQLPTDALNLLCRSAVFRRPVPKTFWLAMIAERTPQQQKAAYYVLGDRALIEKEGIHQNQHLIRQHNLIRDIAYDLLRENTPVWEASERKAAELWLTKYEPAPDVENLEKVRGYLEAFYHYCELKYWEIAFQILSKRLNSFKNETIGWQIGIWGYYREQIALYERVVNKLGESKDLECLNALGIAHRTLGEHLRAINFWQRSLAITRRRSPVDSVTTLAQLAGANYCLNNLSQAIDCFEEARRISDEIGDPRCKKILVGSLGYFHYSRSEYLKAKKYNQQFLNFSKQVGDSRNEGVAKLNLGSTLIKLKDPEALENLHQALRIFREIGDRANEAEALSRLAQLHQKTGEIDLAREYCNRALVLAIELGIPLVKECEELMEEINQQRE